MMHFMVVTGCCKRIEQTFIFQYYFNSKIIKTFITEASKTNVWVNYELMLRVKLQGASLLAILAG